MALNPRLTDWFGRVVWIVGASTGIGRATASRLHGLGAIVVVSARATDALDLFVQQHPGSLALPLDVTDPACAARALPQVLALRGHIDLLLYCAGHYRAMSAQTWDGSEIERHWQVNFLGAVHVLDAVLPQVLQQGHGHISLVASVAGYRGLPQAMAYGPTKAALQHLGDNLYLDLRPRGVGVSVINPGFVATPLTAGNNFHMPALISPEQAAACILRGWARGQFDIHFPKRFTLWLQWLRLLPDACYFALVRRATQP